MEFGARALGNRSIMADPSDHDIVERINFLIKQRDFWMPFAPAIRAEDAHKYLVVPKSLDPVRISPYMMFSFETKPEMRSHMVATLHRADKTARCEVVHKDLNADFHQIITNFNNLTGRGVVMNTSFNIHGEPIALNSKDAISTLLRSAIDELYIGNVLVTKK